MTRITGQSSETSVPSTQCTNWPTCLPDCTRDHGEEMGSFRIGSFEEHEAAIEETERVLDEHRRMMERHAASRYGPGGRIIPRNEPFTAGVPRSSRPAPACPFIPRRVPETLIASALTQRRNAISLTRLPPRRAALTDAERAERQAALLLSGRSCGRTSRRFSRRSSRHSPGRFTRRSPPPASNSYALSSGMPDIGCLNINNEGESSRRALRRSNQRDTQPQVTGDQLAQETDRVWESDIPRQSAPRPFSDNHMMANLIIGSFARVSLPESEEEMSEDGVSTAAENGSEPDELESRLRFALMDGVEHTGRNLPKKD